MGGKDQNPQSELDKWVETQRTEIKKLRDELLGERDDLDTNLRSWTDDASIPLKSPFERFKSFVDTNFSALSEGFKNFPSNVSELKARMQEEREARREEERDIWMRWTGSEDSPDHIKMQVDRKSSDEWRAAKDATYMLLRQSYEKNKHVPAQKILNLYGDSEWDFGGLDQYAYPMLSLGGACYYKPESVENLPSTARWGWPTLQPQWLSINWFKRSPYSPIRLEAHPELCCAGNKWRAAFEDLLSASLDKPMVSEEKVGVRSLYGKAQSTYYGPGLEWMLSLQCRGILPPQLPRLYKPVPLLDYFGDGFDKDYPTNRPRTAAFMQDIEKVTSSATVVTDHFVKRDLNLLIDEVAIKSGPEFGVEPLSSRSAAFVVAPWRVPSTEQELYESMPPFTEPDDSWAPFMTGSRDHDLLEAENTLWEALDAKDPKSAAECLDAYYHTHGNVEDLVKEPLEEMERGFYVLTLSPWVPILNQALRMSSIPYSDYWKQSAHDADTRAMEIADRRSPEETSKAHELIRRVSEVLGAEGPWEPDLPLEELERRVKMLEEYEAKGCEGTREVAKVVPTKQEAEQPKRPEVLSQLTTTQTTRLPDGTVTTKVVLKQRFADGREEEHETVHTTHEQMPAPDTQAPKDTKIHSQDKKKTGWFWS